ncbi:MAG: hypothetical protein PHH83_00235 [Patescibacteria group bacterium]|nr:hypothetical protein [Patescibacteria group bacterium]
MLKIKDSIKDLIENNSFFQFGIYYKLLNLTRVAKFTKPHIQARTKKGVTENAILMCLSRIQGETKRKIKDSDFKIENLTIHSNLCTMTFYKTKLIHEKINKIYSKIMLNGNFMTISEGTNETTIIFEDKFLTDIKKSTNEKPKYIKEKISSLCIKFNSKYLSTPGLLYLILQQIALQNINIIELSSTETEIILYLETKDIKNAFDTIYNKFINPKNTY